MTPEIKKLNNDVLLVQLKHSVQKEKEAIVRTLNYLREVEARKLYLKCGYSSMYKFCISYLGYSESEAQTRIQAMRLMKALPHVEEKLEAGKISLTNAAQIQCQIQRENKRLKGLGQPTLLNENKVELIEKLENTSTRDCQKTLGFPRDPGSGV